MTPANNYVQYLRIQNKKRSLIAASAGKGGTDRQEVNGIVQGHAYSILRLKDVEGFRLVQFRNPWGKFEWKGAWSDSSALWAGEPLTHGEFVTKIVYHRTSNY